MEETSETQSKSSATQAASDSELQRKKCLLHCKKKITCVCIQYISQLASQQDIHSNPTKIQGMELDPVI